MKCIKCLSSASHIPQTDRFLMMPWWVVNYGTVTVTRTYSTRLYMVTVYHWHYSIHPQHFYLDIFRKRKRKDTLELAKITVLVCDRYILFKKLTMQLIGSKSFMIYEYYFYIRQWYYQHYKISNFNFLVSCMVLLSYISIAFSIGLHSVGSIF